MTPSVQDNCINKIFPVLLVANGEPKKVFRMAVDTVPLEEKKVFRIFQNKECHNCAPHTFIVARRVLSGISMPESESLFFMIP